LPSQVWSPSSTVCKRQEWGRVIQLSAPVDLSQHSIPHADHRVPSIALCIHTPSVHVRLIQALRKPSFIFQKAAASALVLSIHSAAAALGCAIKIGVPRRGGHSTPLLWSGVVRFGHNSYQRSLQDPSQYTATVMCSIRLPEALSPAITGDWGKEPGTRMLVLSRTAFSWFDLSQHDITR
jgi:hypothetical protein